MTQKDYNNIEVPVYSNPLKPQSVRVKFKFNDPKETDKGTYIIYNYGVVDANGKDGNLSGFTGLYKALTNLDGVPGNDDGTGNPLQRYTVQQGTVVDVGCYQDNPTDPKSKRYGAMWVEGPVKLFVEGAAAPAQPVTPQPPVNGHNPVKEQPMISSERVQEGSLYREGDPTRDEVFGAISRDYTAYYFSIYDEVEKNFKTKHKDEYKIENVQNATATIFIAADMKAFRYRGLAEPDPIEEMVESKDPALLRIVEIARLEGKARRYQAFIDACVQFTSANEYSVKPIIKKFGWKDFTGDAEQMKTIFECVRTYRKYRDEGFDGDAALTAAAHLLGIPEEVLVMGEKDEQPA